MRTGLTFIVALLAVLISAEGARANCDIGGQEVACPTDNGHYRIRKPEGLGPHPAVVYLYGSFGNSAQKISHDGFVQAFVDRGYAVIVPAGLNKAYRGGEIGSGWFLRNSRANRKRDDTAFVAEVLADAELRHGIDRSRVLIAGMSNGAFLAWEIACHNPTLAAAYAPVAGGYLGKMPRRCQKPVRLLHTHGRADKIVPLSDNSWRSGGVKARPLGEALDRIADTSGCIARGQQVRFREYDRLSWEGCPNGSSVDLLLHNGGHTIPLSWYSVIVDWFERDHTPVTASNEGASTPGARPSFQSAGTRKGFKGIGTDSSGSRFKKPKFTSE